MKKKQELTFRSFPAHLACLIIRAYIRLLSPLKRYVFGPTAGCRFYPSCSHYAHESLRQHGLIRGLIYFLRRILRCHPFHPGGYDPVPVSDPNIALRKHIRSHIDG